MFTAERRERRPLGSRREVPGGIVRMHHDNRPRPRRDPVAQRVEIQAPAMTSARIIKQWIRRQAHIIDGREQIKKRITRLGNQHLIARIAE